MAINILITGNCGVGKTYVLKKLIQCLKLTKQNRIGLLNYLECSKYIVTGKYLDDVFDGSDKLAMNVMSSVDEFLQINKGKIIFYEGDRFTNNKFIVKAKPFIIKILGDGKVGREQRNSNQTQRHLKSIQTRVGNINADLELSNSKVCISVLMHCILHSNNITELKENLNKQKTIHKKKQQSLF